jgi:hypothetical protein
MCQEWASTLKNSPNCVFLMRGEVAIPKRSSHHSRQGEMRAIKISKPDIVKAKIVIVSQPLSSAGIFPHPLSEAILQLLLLLAGSNCLWLIYRAVAFRVFVIGSRCTSVERLLNQVRRAKSSCAVGGAVAHCVFCAIVQLECPGCDRFCIANFYAGGRNVQ